MEVSQPILVQRSLRMWGLVLLLLLLSCLNFADKAVIGLASNPLIHDLKLSPVQWGLIGSSFFFLFSCSSFFLTGLIDRIGSKFFLSVLVCFWSLIQLISGIASGFLMLVVLRVALGASEGPTYGATLTTAAKRTPASQRLFIFALLTLGSALGPAVLSPLLSLLIQYNGWRMSFEVLGVLGLVWLVLWLWWSRTSTDERKQRSNRVQPSIKRILSLFNVQTTWAIAAGFGAYWFLAFLLTWEPQYITDVRQTPSDNVLYLLAISLPWLVGGITQVVIGTLADRIARKRERMYVYVSTLAFVLIIGAGSFALVPLMPSVPLAIFALALAALVGAAFPLVGAILELRAPKEDVGTLQGIGVGLYSLAGLLAPAVTGWSVQHASNHATGYSFAFLIGAGIMIFAGVGCYCTRFRSQHNQPEEDIHEKVDVELSNI
jgi:MFS transporter, ACS family, hexuronate transporter